jgi:hypothetical protein
VDSRGRYGGRVRDREVFLTLLALAVSWEDVRTACEIPV